MRVLRKVVLICLAIIFCVELLHGQDHSLDSLNRIFQLQPDDTHKVVRLDALTKDLLSKGQPDLALKYAVDASALSRRLKYKTGEANAYQLIGYVYAGKNKIAESRKYFFSALKIYEVLNNEKKIARIITLIGSAYGMEENYPAALKYYYDALKRWETLDDKPNIALCLTDIAFCYHSQGNIEECLNHVSKALDIYKEIGNKDGLARTYNFMAVLHLNQGDYTEALKRDSAVLKIYNETGNNVETFYVFQNMGNIDERKGDLANSGEKKEVANILYKQAFINYDKAMQASLRGSDSIMIGEAFANMGKISMKLQNFIEARRYLLKSLQMAQANKANSKNVYSILASIDSTQGNFKEAYTNYRLFIQYRDTLTNEESSRKSTQLRLQYEFDKREAISKAAQDKKNIEVQRVRNLQYSALGAVMLIAALLFRSNRQKQKAKVTIEKAYFELESTQKQLIQSEKMASLGELTAGIAHEIQNPLNFVNNFSEINAELIDELESEVEKGNLNEVKALAQDIKDNEQKINHHGKRADAIVKGMLQHSRSNNGQKELTDINALADEYLRLSYHGMRAKDKLFNVTLKTDFDESIGAINIIPQDIGRVILNLITNAFYAVNEKKNEMGDSYEPTVSLSTKKLNGKVELSVADNGNGIPQRLLDKIFQPFFTTKPTGQGTGLGLSLSYDIVKAHSGELIVETSVGKGSKFVLKLPL